ncbi:MAG: dihydropteroate synthase [Proteobacteria bacterium]|nr:dihydropteroate synthase [Pseudomonadota bacterium]
MKFSRLDEPLIMGILNVTPDSFSDGGKFNETTPAVKHALDMMYEGADIIDVGGESTRPGSERVNAEEQILRVADTIKSIREIALEEVEISIDTTLSKVAEVAIDSGASMINDVSAGNDDPQLFELAADRNVPMILMHMQGNPQTMQINPVYDDVVEDIRAYLLERVEEAIAAGIKEDNIAIDPGIGFGKTQVHNIQLMSELERFVDTGLPVLLGASRKRFMAAICEGVESDELVGATCATTVAGVNAGVQMFRVHDVRPNRQAADVAWAIKNRV